VKLPTRRCKAFAALLLAGLQPAFAQTVYRCGNTISQTPCSPDAEAKRVLGVPPAPASRPASPIGQALCAEAALQQTGTPEPASARVTQLAPRRVEVIRYANQSLAAFRFELAVDAKTAYGLYGGPQHFSCWLSEDQARVLQLQARQP
jgi:hypothetical protein